MKQVYLLAGAPGTGKTSLIWQMLAELRNWLENMDEDGEEG